MAGASLEEQLTRPFVRYPSLLDWAQARAEAHGLTTKLSTAGHRADALAKLIGSRAELAELIASGLLPALQAFTRKGSTSQAFPNYEGCVVNSEAYLHFAGMCGIAGITADAAARDQIDELVRGGILHRGLIINCAECAHVAFTPVENVGTTIQCQRCQADNYLTRARWRSPADEPLWFYDLHPTARDFLGASANGHVPLLLSRHLRSQTRWDLGVEGGAIVWKGQWGQAPPLLGVRVLGTQCSGNSGVAQSPDGKPMMCQNQAWAVHYG